MPLSGTPVGAFWSWWTGELAAAVPLRPAGRGRLVLELSEDGATLADGTGRVIDRAPRGAAALPGRRAGRADVRLGAGLVLRKTVEVPAVAAHELRGLLAYEMDRQTPFDPADVHFAFAVAGRSPSGDRLRVELAVVLRREVEAALALAARSGLEVVSLTAAGDGGERFDLLPPGRHGGAGRRRRGPLAAMALAVMAVVAAGVGLYGQAAELEAERRTLAALRTQAEAVAGLRGRVERLEAQDAALRARKAAEPSFLALLRDLTDTLPDDTWLSRLSYTGGRLDLVGASRTASSLVAALEERPLFTQARFRAPLTLDPATGAERFRISLQVPGEAERP